MREFEVAMGGNTPKHSRPWSHINYIPEGCGTLLMGDNSMKKKGGRLILNREQCTGSKLTGIKICY